MHLTLLFIVIIIHNTTGTPTICSCCADPVTDKGIIIDNMCYQSNVKSSLTTATIYTAGRNIMIENYLYHHVYYTGPRYIRLGQNWIYDTETKQTTKNIISPANNVTDIFIIPSLYHVYTEDYSQYPKHFVHKGIYYNPYHNHNAIINNNRIISCCDQWKKVNFFH